MGWQTQRGFETKRGLLFRTPKKALKRIQLERLRGLKGKKRRSRGENIKVSLFQSEKKKCIPPQPGKKQKTG